MNDATTKQMTVTLGLDLGDRYIQVCILDEAGVILEESRLPNKRAALERRFSGSEPLRIVLEAGTYSPWVSRLLEELGYDVIVANPRKVRLIYLNESKSDRVDAEYLARVGRLDPRLVAPFCGHLLVQSMTVSTKGGQLQTVEGKRLCDVLLHCQGRLKSDPSLPGGF